jgi:glycosyltransferase involved in cell wall biosynthesis/GT2 family glycosyltransferase
MSTSDLLFSIIVNTTDRAASLRTLLRALDYQSYPHFEVIAVVGPTKDNTLAMLEEFGGRVRVLRCSRANLSVSRNIGLAAACGDIVAFIDDDAVPSRNWLRQLRRIFADPAIAGSGGSVYVVHPNQPVIQHRLGVASALAEQIDVRRSLLADMPLTGDGRLWTLRMMGTNMAYRRAALLDIGGFDEFYEWVYDDTDVAMRLAAAGKLLQPVADAVVYHVPASSRNRVAYSYLGRWWIQTKAATYFAHRNGRAAGVPPQVINKRNLHLVHGHWTWTGQLRRDGRISWRQMTNMRWNELKSSARGYTAGTRGRRRLLADTALEPSDERRFQPFQTPASPYAPAVDPVSGRQPAITMPDPPLRVALLSFNYPPEQQEGVGRHTNLMARGLFELGHTVHVLTHSAQESISFYDGAYVHRVPYHLDRYQNLRHLPKVHHRLNYSHAVHERLLRLILNDDIQLADTPVWQSDGFVTARAGALPVVVRPQTAVRQVAALEQQHDADTRLIAEIEEELLRRATAIAPNSQATVRALHEYYGIAAPPDGFTVIPHGIEPAPEEAVRPFPLTGSPAARTVLYVGRLERRKGILDLFAAIPAVLKAQPAARFILAGADNSGADGFQRKTGLSYPAYFARQHPQLADRVAFLGHVTDAQLQELYQSCDLFVAPSLYESFGLIYLEAMNYAKPVIGCRAGGIPEVIDDGVSGLLVDPEAPEQLAAAILRLVASPTLLHEYGLAGRCRLLTHFTHVAMAQQFAALYRRVLASPHLTEGQLP